MLAVSNATPLIYLAKLSKLHLLIKIFRKIIIPVQVYTEVITKGKKLNKPEVIVIEKLIKTNFIEIKKFKAKREIETLHKGECDAISLALKEKISNVLIDDKEGVEICKILGLKPFRTTALLLLFLKQNLINLEEFKELLIKLSKNGYFLRAEVFEFLVKEAKR